MTLSTLNWRRREMVRWLVTCATEVGMCKDAVQELLPFRQLILDNLVLFVNTQALQMFPPFCYLESYFLQKALAMAVMSGFLEHMME